jgi:hypothetical protein
LTSTPYTEGQDGSLIQDHPCFVSLSCDLNHISSLFHSLK